jgi:competence protein ComK
MSLNNYIINEETIMLTGVYSHHGALQTMVVETGKTFRVNGTAERILSNSLKKMGTTLRGELDITREKLGNLKMCPIKLNSQSGLYFFPSKSPKRPDCVWFSLFHVKGAVAFGKNKTKVYMSHNHSFIVDCTLSSFNNKLRRSQELRRKIAEQEMCPITFYLEPAKSSLLSKADEKDRNFSTDD